jgi:AcrR family transcriptional regulator
MFNDEGLARVGVRDIARAVEMSPGNLAYHFATKDDLVEALVVELHERNLANVFAAVPAHFSLATLYELAVGAMRNMLAYRFVLLGYVDTVRTSAKLRRFERTLAEKRRARHDAMLEALVRDGWIERRALARSDVLYEQGSMISSGWLGAAALRGWSDHQAVLHFAKLGCALLEPWCTAKGARLMRRILAGDFDSGGR